MCKVTFRALILNVVCWLVKVLGLRHVWLDGLKTLLTGLRAKNVISNSCIWLMWVILRKHVSTSFTLLTCRIVVLNERRNTTKYRGKSCP